MKFTVDYPIVLAGHDSGLVTAEGMTRVAQAAEECGYDALQRSGGLSGSVEGLSFGLAFLCCFHHVREKAGGGGRERVLA